MSRLAEVNARTISISKVWRLICMPISIPAICLHFGEPLACVRGTISPGRVSVLPFLERQSLYDSLQLSSRPLDAQNQEALSVFLESIQCPSTPDYIRRISEMGFGESTYTGLQVAAHDYVPVHDVSTSDQQFPLRGAFNGGPDLQSMLESYSGDGTSEPPPDRFNPELRILPGNRKLITDGLSNTALLVEQSGKPLQYGPSGVGKVIDPSEGAWGTCDFSFFYADGVNQHNHSGAYGFHIGANVAMCDGSVHMWAAGIADEVVAALLSRDAGEIIASQDWQ